VKDHEIIKALRDFDWSVSDEHDSMTVGGDLFMKNPELDAIAGVLIEISKSRDCPPKYRGDVVHGALLRADMGFDTEVPGFDNPHYNIQFEFDEATKEDVFTLSTDRDGEHDHGCDRKKTQVLAEPLKFRLAHFLLAFPECQF
jgi:hypothetical protein